MRERVKRVEKVGMGMWMRVSMKVGV